MAIHIKTVGLVGAGQMGVGIAQASACAGFETLVYDLSMDSLNAGKARFIKGINRALDQGKLDQKAHDDALERCRFVDTLDPFSDCDLVIEAVIEDEAAKQQLFKQLDEQAKPHTILASNTSSLSITRMAAALSRPQSFIGIHFFNPVHSMKLVEIIKGLATSDETCESVYRFIEALGKVGATVSDYPGFIVNRILIPMINEAIFVLGEGVASVSDIDKAMKLGTHHPMGPLELADFIGLDTCLAIQDILYKAFADSKYRPAPLLKQFVDAGRLGRKSGQGFYTYSDAGKVISAWS